MHIKDNKLLKLPKEKSHVKAYNLKHNQALP